MVTIDYEALVQEYNDSLANVLRGFRPKYDFLELWVPDSDDERSIINLVESAQSFGIASIRLSLEQNTFGALNLESFKSEIETMGRLEIIEEKSKMIISVSHLVEESQVRESNDLGKGLLDEIPTLYRSKFAQLLKDIKFEGSVQEDDSNLLIRSFNDGVSLFAAVDPKHHIIRHVAFSGAFTDVNKGMMEGVCRIINGTSVQEASDHGILKLELSLRDDNQPKSVVGIVTPFNLAPCFNLPLKMLRGLLAIYREKTNYSDTKNFWDENPQKSWRDATVEERMDLVQKALDQHLAEHGFIKNDVVVSNIDKAIKVSIIFQKETPSTKKATYMLAMEKLLRKEVEPKLELYQEMWKDKNKTRRL